MPAVSLTCPCSALQSGVASRRLLPTQNSGEPYRVTGKYSELKGGVERRLQHSLIRNVTWNRALRRDASRLLPHGE